MPDDFELETARRLSRREWLSASGMGFGALALQCMLQREALGGVHHPARAKRVIWLFMEGGPSHLDMLDPKPLLNQLAGQPLPISFGEPITAMGEKGSPLLASPRKWTRYGQSGMWASDWIPHIGQCMDDIAVLRACWTNGINHAGGVCQMNTCINFAGRPSLGSWIQYGLGSLNDNLPSFVVMCDNPGRPVNGPRNWGSGFMPASYQGVRIHGTEPEPIANLHFPAGLSETRLTSKLNLLNQFNRSFANTYPQQTELEARIRSYELAFGMQAAAPDALDSSRETEATNRLYGLDQQETQPFGKICLLARRLVEHGVRFVQLYSGTGSKWDSHSSIETSHAQLCRSMDKPVAGLLQDLKQRGLLDDTLVVWAGEFGRTPMSEKKNGRDHNPTGFSIWMAGGGVQGGQAIGSTDELGLYAIQERMHVHDIHASILWLMGLDHMQLSYDQRGRIERPTINEGRFQSRLVSSV
ncbi:MAG: DUF1501 domain-containing protein [Pirellulaceae bacterium]|nr:DUF1501 domain-containing protein [Pirellulaceae bacterium]